MSVRGMLYYFLQYFYAQNGLLLTLKLTFSCKLHCLSSLLPPVRADHSGSYTSAITQPTEQQKRDPPNTSKKR